MRITLKSAFILCIISILSCSSAEKKILGKWEGIDDNAGTCEYFKNGTYTFKDTIGNQYTGKYEINEETLTIYSPPGLPSLIINFRILELTGEHYKIQSAGDDKIYASKKVEK